MIVNNEFIRSDRMGKGLHHLIAMGWEIEVEVDKFGTGIMMFHHPVNCTTFVEFTEFNVNDWVEIQYNELGTIKRVDTL